MTTGSLLTAGGRFGDYRVIRRLGKGGMGEVYLVRDTSGNDLAVKVMSAAADNHEARRRFAREAAAAMEIRHPNLVAVYDVGEDPETHLCYISMEYVSGGNVSERLAKNGRFTIREAVAVAAYVADALEAAHRKGVVHRDLKPENIMFDGAGRPRLADLGIAKVLRGKTTSTITETGMMIGTPAYMSPEQMVDSRSVDARSDVYSLGIVLFQMLTGKRPNAKATVVEMLSKAIKGEAIPDVRTERDDVPDALAKLIARMCAPKKEARPSAAEVAGALREFAKGGRTANRRLSLRLWLRLKRWMRPVERQAAVAGLWLVSLALCFAVGYRIARATRPAATVVERKEIVTNFVDRVRIVDSVVEKVRVVTNFVERPIAAPELLLPDAVPAARNEASTPVDEEAPVVEDEEVARNEEAAVSPSRTFALEDVPFKFYNDLRACARSKKMRSLPSSARGCLVFGVLEVASGKPTEVTTEVTVKRKGTFTGFVPGDRPFVTFQSSRSGEVRIEVPEADAPWNGKLAVDLGTVVLESCDVDE